ncbi:MAG: TolC family protein, partial [Bacteroidales bacterium]
MKKKLLILLLFLILYHSEMITAQSSEPFKLTMQQMFELAETNSKSIRLFDIAEKEAQQAVKVAKNASLPSIDIALSTSYLGNGWLTDRNFSNGQSASIPHFGNNFAIEASQVIYAGGAISHNIAKAELASQLAQYEKEKNRQEIRFFLVGHYLELYKLCNQTGVYLQNIEQTKRLLFNIKARQNEGLALKNDITRYELQLKLLELQLTQIENSKIILNNQLATVLGFPPHTRIEIDTSILNPLPLPLSETDWQETATISSPLLKQAKLVIEQSKHDEKIVAAERLPSIVLFAADHLDGPILIEIPPVNQNFNYWYAGVSLKYNMGSFYKTGRNIKLARLSTQKA